MAGIEIKKLFMKSDFLVLDYLLYQQCFYFQNRSKRLLVINLSAKEFLDRREDQNEYDVLSNFITRFTELRLSKDTSSKTNAHHLQEDEIEDSDDGLLDKINHICEKYKLDFESELLFIRECLKKFKILASTKEQLITFILKIISTIRESLGKPFIVECGEFGLEHGDLDLNTLKNTNSGDTKKDGEKNKTKLNLIEPMKKNDVKKNNILNLIEDINDDGDDIMLDTEINDIDKNIAKDMVQDLKGDTSSSSSESEDSTTDDKSSSGDTKVELIGIISSSEMRVNDKDVTSTSNYEKQQKMCDDDIVTNDNLPVDTSPLQPPPLTLLNPPFPTNSYLSKDMINEGNKTKRPRNPLENSDFDFTDLEIHSIPTTEVNLNVQHRRPKILTSHTHKKQVWTCREEQELVRLADQIGVGHWADIKASGKFPGRSNVDLKDKWRNLMQGGRLQLVRSMLSD